MPAIPTLNPSRMSALDPPAAASKLSPTSQSLAWQVESNSSSVATTTTADQVITTAEINSSKSMQLVQGQQSPPQTATTGVSAPHESLSAQLGTLGAKHAILGQQKRLNKLMHGAMGRKQENEVLDILRGTKGMQLDQLLTGISAPYHLHDLISQMNDRFMGEKNRTVLINLLSQERSHDLSPKTRNTLITALLRGWTDNKKEVAIINILRSANDSDLNTIMQRVDLPELLSSIDGDNFSQFQQLILPSGSRFNDLTVTTRAAMVHSLQEQISISQPEANVAATIILNTHGGDLNKLKNAIDSDGDILDLHRLVFQTFANRDLAAPVLKHITTEAAAKSGKLKTLSDADYTIYPSKMAVMLFPVYYTQPHDNRFPEKENYPGVFAFHRVLDQANDPDSSGDLAYLTARPIGEASTLANMAERGDITGATALHAGLGGIIDAIEDIVTFDFEAMAARKVKHFNEYKQLYPEYDFVFIGDSGQGDLPAAIEMRTHDRDKVPLTFIHNVTQMSNAEKTNHREQGIIIFDYYPEAAMAAHQAGLIDAAAVEDVIADSLQGVADIKFDSNAQRAVVEDGLNQVIKSIRTKIAETTAKTPSNH